MAGTRSTDAGWGGPRVPSPGKLTLKHQPLQPSLGPRRKRFLSSEVCRNGGSGFRGAINMTEVTLRVHLTGAWNESYSLGVPWSRGIRCVEGNQAKRGTHPHAFVPLVLSAPLCTTSPRHPFPVPGSAGLPILCSCIMLSLLFLG